MGFNYVSYIAMPSFAIFSSRTLRQVFSAVKRAQKMHPAEQILLQFVPAQPVYSLRFSSRDRRPWRSDRVCVLHPQSLSNTRRPAASRAPSHHFVLAWKRAGTSNRMNGYRRFVALTKPVIGLTLAREVALLTDCRMSMAATLRSAVKSPPNLLGYHSKIIRHVMGIGREFAYGKSIIWKPIQQWYGAGNWPRQKMSGAGS